MWAPLYWWPPLKLPALSTPAVVSKYTPVSNICVPVLVVDEVVPVIYAFVVVYEEYLYYKDRMIYKPRNIRGGFFI